MRFLHFFILNFLFLMLGILFSENQANNASEYYAIKDKALEIISKSDVDKKNPKKYEIYSLNENLKTIVKRVPEEDKDKMIAIQIYFKEGKLYRSPNDIYYVSDYWLKKGAEQIEASEIIKYIVTNFSDQNKKIAAPDDGYPYEKVTFYFFALLCTLYPVFI